LSDVCDKNGEYIHDGEVTEQMEAQHVSWLLLDIGRDASETKYYSHQ
jgi:hypothetical protein